MKITLIYPSQRKSNVKLANWQQSRFHRYPGLGLPIVASLCPSSTEVKIIDDDFEEIDYNEHTGIVGISTWTVNAKRAYEISNNFREKNIPVVLGGMHVSACPEEAKIHADAIVIGEAEDTWPSLFEDFNSGRLKKVYQSSNNSSLENMPWPRRDLLKQQRHISINTVQASRGCPFNCEFCSMASILGTQTRVRPVEEVIEEIKSLHGRYILFNDNNLAQEFDYYKELFRRLIPLKKKWGGQASWNIIKDREMLELMAKSGCKSLHVGFETLQSQLGVPKIPPGDNSSLFKEAVKTLHSHNICVFGAFVLGFDNEDESVFEKTLKFALESHMEIAQFTTLTPYPGTRLYKRLEKENRITERDWDNYMFNNICFKLQNMSRETFLRKNRWMKTKYFSYKRIGSRVIRAIGRTNPLELGLLLGINFAYKKSIKGYSV